MLGYSLSLSQSFRICLDQPNSYMAFKTLSKMQRSWGIGRARLSYETFTILSPSSIRRLAAYPARQKARTAMASEDEHHSRDLGNAGLQIKRTFKHLGHKYWGFLVYRCTYRDDHAWSRFMAILNRSVQESLQYDGTKELMDSLNHIVREDPSLLDGVSKELVRQRFREWVASPEADAERQMASAQPVLIDGIGSTPRYSYCVHVDEDALRSVVHDGNGTPEEGMTKIGGYVNLIKADWALPSGEEAEERRREFEIEDPCDEGEEPVEDCRMYDVGWMKVSIDSLMPGMYAMLQSGAWDENYVRPPDVAGT